MLILITLVILFINRTPPTREPQTQIPAIIKPSAPSVIPEPSPFPPPTSPAELEKYQAETDKIYADLQKKQDEDYPWLQQMPLQATNYFVYFETSNDTFTAEIYSQAQSEQIKQEILQRLNGLNIDVSKYNIKWEIKQR